MNRAASAAVNDTANVQKGSGTIWTFVRRASSSSNVQIVPDPFWTLARDD